MTIKNITKLTLLSLSLFMVSCAQKVTESGHASYYGDKFEGRKTASGEKYKASRLTAAHRTLPFGTTVKVKNLDNGKVVKVVVNDRGPFVSGRIIDVSGKAANQLEMKNTGTAKVEIKYKKPKRNK